METSRGKKPEQTLEQQQQKQEAQLFREYRASEIVKTYREACFRAGQLFNIKELAFRSDPRTAKYEKAKNDWEHYTQHVLPIHAEAMRAYHRRLLAELAEIYGGNMQEINAFPSELEHTTTRLYQYFPPDSFSSTHATGTPKLRIDLPQFKTTIITQDSENGMLVADFYRAGKHVTEGSVNIQELLVWVRQV
ncbi:MAG: hypothetical protein HYV32_03115 [Candidatus Kerfeldbacteria bacterium]|nr:hypothetical protein [Candidatus Kerfeldbacteria bacterium]